MGGVGNGKTMIERGVASHWRRTEWIKGAAPSIGILCGIGVSYWPRGATRSGVEELASASPRPHHTTTMGMGRPDLSSTTWRLCERRNSPARLASSKAIASTSFTKEQRRAESCRARHGRSGWAP